MEPLHLGAPRTHVGALFTLAVFILVQITHSQKIECSASANKDQPPAFLCGALIKLRRERDCSLTVSEKVTFPHTVDTTFQRNLFILSDVQSVSKLSVLFNDSRRIESLILPQDEENSATIQFETEASTSSSFYSIRYTVSNGALRFSRSCDGTDGRSFPRDNVIRWRSGLFEEAVDEIIVEFESSTNGTLSFVGLDSKFESQSSSGALQLTARNVTDEIEAYVREAGAELCTEDLVCDDSGLGAWIIFLIVAGAVLVLVSVIIVWFLVKKRKARSGAEWNANMDAADVAAA